VCGRRAGQEMANAAVISFEISEWRELSVVGRLYRIIGQSDMSKLVAPKSCMEVLQMASCQKLMQQAQEQTLTSRR